MNPRYPFILAGGLLFGFGLAFSGMTRQEVVLSFLTLHDFGLILVLGAAALLDMLAVNLAPKTLKQPLTGGVYRKRFHALNRRVIVGAGIFGVGWGMSGLCPGSAVASLGTGNVAILVGITSMFLGAYLHGAVASSIGSRAKTQMRSWPER